MWFGLYLHDRNLITPDQLVTALRKRFRTHKPLGELAVKSGKLSPKQLYELLLKQIHDSRPLGELAIASGYLSRCELAELLLQQSEDAISLPEALVEMEVFTPDEVQRHLDDGHRAMAERAQGEVGMATAV